MYRDNDYTRHFQVLQEVVENHHSINKNNSQQSIESINSTENYSNDVVGTDEAELAENGSENSIESNDSIENYFM